MTIPWYKMPVTLRATPFEEREQKLKEYEQEFGSYSWDKEFYLDVYADIVTDEQRLFKLLTSFGIALNVADGNMDILTRCVEAQFTRFVFDSSGKFVEVGVCE